MSQLFDYFDMTNISKYICFTPTLSRGLDYYTGLIYEVVYNDKNVIGSSIAAGGRYNNLVGKLSHQKDISAIGVSIGIDRIVTILETLKNKVDIPPPLVYVASVGPNMLPERLKLLIELRKNGIYADMSHSTNPKMKNQLNQVFDAKIPYMMLIGESEINKGTVALKNIYTKEQQELDRHEAIKLLKSIRLTQ
jgi:histidyl-tRNA synthetase